MGSTARQRAVRLETHDDSGSWRTKSACTLVTSRVLYVAKFAEAIYVLHAFEKKTQRASKQDVDRVALRYRQLVAERKRAQ